MTTRNTGSTEPAGSSARGLTARRAGLHVAVVAVVAALGGAALGGAAVAQSAVLGVLLGAINLLAMRRITRAMMGASDVAPSGGAAPSAAAGEGGSAVWALALPVKLIALVGVAYLLVQSGVALAVPLAVGFALLPLTSVFVPQPSSVRGRA